MEHALEAVAQERPERLSLADTIKEPEREAYPLRGEIEGQQIARVAPLMREVATLENGRGRGVGERGGVDVTGTGTPSIVLPVQLFHPAVAAKLKTDGCLRYLPHLPEALCGTGSDPGVEPVRAQVQ